MEDSSPSVHKVLRSFWTRRGYQKLKGSRRRQPATAELGRSSRRKRIWRVRVSPKLKLSRVIISAPKRLLVWLRDAYVSMMLKLANSSVGYGGAYGGGDDGFGGGPRAFKEYDERMIMEIYKSMVAAQGLVPRGSGGPGTTQIVCKR